MAGIRGKDTLPELKLRRALHAAGFRYRLHDRRLPGRPDLVLPRFNAAVFIHGCFWHQHNGCRFATTPATRPEFWQQKFASNIERDQRNEAALQHNGWRVALVWECALKSRGAAGVADEIAAWLLSASTRVEIGTPGE